MNHKVLLRSFPSVVDILEYTGFSKLYELRKYPTQEWLEVNVKGPLFLTANSDDSYSFVILNQYTTDNFQDIILKDMKRELKEDQNMIFYVNQEGKIFALWIQDGEKLKSIYEYVVKVTPDYV